MANADRNRGSWLLWYILAGTMILDLFGCDPAARTTVRIAQPSASTEGSGPALVVSTVDADAVVSIVNDVAREHGLDPTSSAHPGALVTYHRRWDYNGDGHARSITVSVQKRTDESGTVEITVFEWLAFRHSSFGRALLNDLRARLRGRFGPDAVSSVELDEPGGLSANSRLQRTALRAAAEPPSR